VGRRRRVSICVEKEQNKKEQNKKEQDKRAGASPAPTLNLSLSAQADTQRLRPTAEQFIATLLSYAATLSLSIVGAFSRVTIFSPSLSTTIVSPSVNWRRRMPDEIGFSTMR